jgi:hypothetical protein
MKKICKKCNEELYLDSFHKSNNSKDGHVNKCKSCVKEYSDKINNDIPRVTCSVCSKTKWSKSFIGNSPVCSSCEQKILKINTKKLTCKSCNLELDTDNFNKSKNYLNGFNTKCKKCCSDERNNDDFRRKNNIKVKAYYKKRFFYFRATMILNRSKKEGVECNITVKELAVFLSKQWKKQKGYCSMTGDRLTRENSVVDHILAIANNGDSNINNLRWVTKDANDIKGSLTDEKLNEIILKLIKTSNINYIDSFIRQFSEELSEEDWSITRFLNYLKLNNYHMFKIK